jgi:hypothetical protein
MIISGCPFFPHPEATAQARALGQWSAVECCNILTQTTTYMHLLPQCACLIYSILHYSILFACSDPVSEEDEEKADDQCRAGCCACR